MSAKKRVESEEASINVDPFAQNLSAINPDFNLDELISACREKLASESKLKVPIQERIIKNREAIERIKRTIASLEAKTAQQGSQTWIGVVLKPLADQLKGIFPNAVVEIMEPNNMTGAITVTVSKKGASLQDRRHHLAGDALSGAQVQEARQHLFTFNFFRGYRLRRCAGCRRQADGRRQTIRTPALP